MMKRAEIYSKMEKAIQSMRDSNGADLDSLAALVDMSPSHFQKTFTNWAGVSPKKFSQLISLAHAKQLIKQMNGSQLQTTLELGLSSVSRLHDLFVRIERMSPAEYQSGGAGLKMKYDVLDTRFGNLLVAETHKGICYAQFVRADEDIQQLREEFPKAVFEKLQTERMVELERFINDKQRPDKHFTLHLKGTDFQVKVWQALLSIPEGRISTYGKIGCMVGKEKASRAVGTAIGSNNIAVLIPCHRVIRATGELGGYRWGIDRKSSILGTELNEYE